MSASGAPYHLAYVFQRFPTFTQTFCVREILELERQGIRPLIFSVRDPRDEPAQSYPESLKDRVVFLPDEESLKAYAAGLRDSRELPKAARSALRYWGKARDKMRVYEAIWIHQEIRKRAPLSSPCPWPFCRIGGPHDVVAAPILRDDLQFHRPRK